MVRTLLIAVILTANASAQLPPVGPRIAMEDQFGRPHDVADHKGDVLVLVYSDKAGADASKVLGEKLQVYFHPSAKGQAPEIAQKAPVKPIADWPNNLKTPDAKVVAIACIGEVPGIVKAVIKSKFKSASPAVPVWLDMTDAMRKAFGVTPSVANVVVFDKAGAPAFQMTGAFDDAQIHTLVTQIDTLRSKR
ncbi:MAG: hypothetical protein U0746_11380 [Gemmataceae bacterium]